MVKGKFSYRLACRQDIEAMYEIEILASNIWKRDYFVNELENSFSSSIVALEGEKIIGFAVAWDVKGEIQLNNIGIHPEYRRCGAATGLLRFILQLFKKTRPEKILIEVKSSNSEAMAFYRHLGFYKTGLRKNYYNTDDAVLMEKIIIDSQEN